MNLKEVGFESVECIRLPPDREGAEGSFIHNKSAECMRVSSAAISFSRWTLLYEVRSLASWRLDRLHFRTKETYEAWVFRSLQDWGSKWRDIKMLQLLNIYIYMCVCVCVCVCFSDVFRFCCHYILYPIYLWQSCKTRFYMPPSVDTPRTCLNTLAEIRRIFFLIINVCSLLVICMFYI